MTEDKHRKRAARALAKKLGISYTAALQKIQVVPAFPGEIAAAAPCPFCGGTAYMGHRGLIAASENQPMPEHPEDQGVAHSRPSCDTFKRLSADEFVKACVERLRQ